MSLSLQDNPFKLLMGLDENIASNWDLYLITFITIFLGMIIYSRRPPPEETPMQQNNTDQPPQHEATDPSIESTSQTPQPQPPADNNQNPNDAVQ